MSPNLKDQPPVDPGARLHPGPSIEARLAKKLAANEPHIRAQALKKLAQWLRARASAGLMTPEETLALWKGLYFCFWMSDQPLIQESQAQAIADLLGRAFTPDSPPAWQFARGFFLTLQREWLGLDRFRMDKFMMLVRRFLRATFSMVQHSGWSASATQALAREIVVPGVLAPTAVKPNLGFQMHVVDVYLEELAKVGGDRITAPVLWAVVRPFAQHIQNGSADARLLAHIQSRIFHHLMRQSDDGIAYDEYLQGDLAEPEITASSDDEEPPASASDESEAESEAEALDDLAEPLDPRAGGVHVTIPQLSPDWLQMSQDLFDLGQAAEVTAQRRKILFELTRQFRQLAEGKYPLSAELSDEDQIEVPTVSTKKVLKRRHQEELQTMARLREERRLFQQTMKAKKRGLSQPSNAQPEEMIEKAADGSEDSEEEVQEEQEPTPPPKKKSKRLDNPSLSKNQKQGQKAGLVEKKQKKVEPASLVVKKQEKTEKITLGPSLKPQKKIEKITALTPPSPAPPIAPPLIEQSPISPKKSKKMKKKKLLVNQETSKKVEETPDAVIQTQITDTKFQEIDFDTDTKSTTEIQTVQTKTKAKRHSEPVISPLSGKKAKKQRRQSEVMPTSGISGYDAPTIKSPARASLPTPTFVKKAKNKVKSPQWTASSGLPPKSVVLSSEKKKLNFSLTMNKTQSLRDVDSAMMDSPEIPFCSAKKPKKGLLKNKFDISIVNTPSPISKREVVMNTQRNSVSKTAKLLNRMSASDFF